MVSQGNAVDHMNAYKGTAFPPPLVPLSGLVLSVGLPVLVYRCCPSEWGGLEPTESLLILLQAYSTISILFFVEFACGAAARATSPKASFSPAAATSTGTAPFELIQCNRIHQNHIECAFIFMPASLAATAAGADVAFIVASTVTWVVARLSYRVGYCQITNPFLRLVGFTASMMQAIACMVAFAHAIWIHRK